MTEVAILAPGPSASAAVAETLKGKRLIVVGNAWELAPWAEALVADRTTGRLRLPGGARLPDGDAETPALAFDNGSGVGLFRPASGQMGFATGGVQRALLGGTALQLDVPLTGAAVTASATDTTAGRVLRVGAGWPQLDATLYRQGNLLGTVSQSAGTPTGAVIERGSTASGDYVRFADGKQPGQDQSEKRDQAVGDDHHQAAIPSINQRTGDGAKQNLGNQANQRSSSKNRSRASRLGQPPD